MSVMSMCSFWCLRQLLVIFLKKHACKNRTNNGCTFAFQSHAHAHAPICAHNHAYVQCMQYIRSNCKINNHFPVYIYNYIHEALLLAWRNSLVAIYGDCDLCYIFINCSNNWKLIMELIMTQTIMTQLILEIEEMSFVPQPPFIPQL